MPKPIMTITYSDIDTLARTVYGEARGEPFLGKLAVAWVIKNRWLADIWPESIAEVCVEKNQFSCWNSNDQNRPLIAQINIENNETMMECHGIASGILANLPTLSDPTKEIGGADHYVNPDIISLDDSTKWYGNLDGRECVNIGRHRFWRLRK